MSEQQPLVSFIITYYNIPVSQLRECISSIMALTLSETEREIILIDDGANVSPLNEIIDFRDSIIYLRQKNSGLSMARNMGLEICRGKYIQFVDADDALIQTGYEHCLDIVRYQNPDIVLFNYTKEENDVDTPYIFDGPFTGAEYIRHNNLRASACAYIFRKQLLANLRFTPGLLHEDEEFTPQIILRADVLYATDTCAYFYRQRPTSIMHDNNVETKQKRLDDAEYIIFQLDHLAATLPLSERTALQRRVAQLTMDYLYNIIILSRSEATLSERIERLRKRGLFPLPKRDYTKKYNLFRKMTNSPLGRKILLRTLPLISQ